MSQNEIGNVGFRGVNHGDQLKPEGDCSVSGYTNCGTANFNVLFGGYSYYAGHFYGNGWEGALWSSSDDSAESPLENSECYTWIRTISNYSRKVSRDYYYKFGSLSCHCVQD